MVSKVMYQAIKKQLNECLVALDSPAVDVYYKNHNWDGGYESNHGYDGTREEFYSDQREMFNFLYEYFISLGANCCIIAPLDHDNYFEGWSNIKDIDIYKNIVEVLKHYNVRTNSRSGIKIRIPDDFWIIKRFVEGGFRYISRAYLFFPEQGLVVEPHHHMNLLIYSKEDRIVAHTMKLQDKYPNLYFDKY